MNLTSVRLLAAARFAVPAAAALTLTVGLAAPASASPAYVTRSFGQVYFTALPGETNTVTFSSNASGFFVNDSTATLLPGAGCTTVDTHTVRCGAATGVSRISAVLGDQNDVATNDTAVPSDLVGGAGQDRLIGGTGPDRLTDNDGWVTAPGTNTFEGRGGNDVIISRNAHFDRVDCGPGLDVAIADPATLDVVVPGTCEVLSR
ncbi:hypothetical protein [Streptomyces sp. NPDC089799]|uniref:hypothetical protein n=1 Tax=Streptomyces sp. NPDC089799 TaxID=3155066 RepID=UPI00342A300F